jgi:Domain of unknown function (DUF4177)
MTSPSLSSHRFRSVVACLIATFVFGFCFEASAAPAKWEYAVESARLKNRPLQDLLNRYAGQGWELVQITDNGVAVFRRVRR